MVVIPLVVAGLDEQVEVVLVDGVRNQQVRGNNTQAVVIGLSIESGLSAELLAQLGARSLTLKDGGNQNERNAGFVGHILVNGHGLVAVNNVLEVADIAVLAGDDGLVGTGIVGDDGLCNARGSRVVGAESNVKDSAVAVVGGKGVLEVLESGVGAPRRSGDLLKGGLAGGDLQGAGIDEGLEGIEGAVEEVAGIGVGRVAGGELDVIGLVARVLEVESLDHVLRLQDADGVVIEGYIVGNVRVLDQAVVGDDDNAGIGGVGQRLAQGGGVDGGDDEHVNAVGDHIGNIVVLLNSVIVGVGQLHLEAGSLELLLQVGTVTVPALKGFCRHGDADGLGVIGISHAAAGKREDHNQCQNHCDCFFHWGVLLF